jgi:AhpD family alkylhydroperoxidase
VPGARARCAAQTRERIALAVAEINRCDYCLSAHSYLGKNLAKLDDAEIVANRSGASTTRRRTPPCGLPPKWPPCAAT